MPKVTPHQLNLMTDGTVQLYQELEMTIFQLIAKRLKNQPDGNINIAEWQLDKMQQLHLLNADVIRELSEISGKASQEIERVIKTAGYAIVDDTDNYFEEPKPYPSNLDLIIEGYKNQTFRDVNNFVNQTLISTNYGMGNISNMFTDIVNKTALLYSSGFLTLDKAIQKTINEWIDKGIQSSFVDKGGHTWSMERYVATVMRSTMQRIYNEVRTARMAEYDCHTVLVTSLPQARIACAHCQGQVIDVRSPEQADSGYPSAYLFGYGTPGGHRGVNCRHKWIPFIPGVSTNNQPQYDPDRAIENGKIEQGRKALAGRIRNTKKKLMVAESLGAENASKYKQLLNNQQAQMRDLVKENGLHRIYRLEKVYTPKQSVLDGGYQAVLTKAEKKRASEQYDRYRSILGDRAPKSLDDYINLKYNGGERYERLKDRAYIQGKFNDGSWLDKINPEKQEKHFKIANRGDKSYFYDWVDINKLYDDYKLTGNIRHREKGRTGNELIDISPDLKIGRDVYTGKYINGFTIKYSSTGSHLIPTYNKE